MVCVCVLHWLMSVRLWIYQYNRLCLTWIYVFLWRKKVIRQLKQFVDGNHFIIKEHARCKYSKCHDWIFTCWFCLTHWGRVTLICVGNVTITGSDNGLSPGRRQAITWTNVGILLIEPLGTNLNEMLIEIHTFSFKKIQLKMSSGKWRQFWPGLNVLKYKSYIWHHGSTPICQRLLG